MDITRSVACCCWVLGSRVDFRGGGAGSQVAFDSVPGQEPVYGRWQWRSRPCVKGHPRGGPLRSLPEGKGKLSTESLDNTLKSDFDDKVFFKSDKGQGREGS